jgi:hypothetical protein
MLKFLFVREGFGAGLAYPTGQFDLFVDDFDATKRPVMIVKRFCAGIGTKNASQTTCVQRAPIDPASIKDVGEIKAFAWRDWATLCSVAGL